MRLLFLLLLVAMALPAAAEPMARCGPQTDVADSERLANTISWTTASEEDNLGYNIFRSLSEDGPFKKITEMPIPGHGTTSLTNKYSYRDSAINPCQAYWYYVQSVSFHGERERFTPIVRVAPKRQPEPAVDAAGSALADPAVN